MTRIRSFFLAAAVVLLLAASALAGDAASLPAALANDNRTPAGTLRDAVLTIRLEIREALWYPEQEGGPNLPVYAFAEEGREPRIPGPLFRVPQGATVHAYVTNRLPLPMFVHGLHQRPGPGTVLEIPAGATREVRFPAGAPGTYFYEARSINQTTPQPPPSASSFPSPTSRRSTRAKASSPAPSSWILRTARPQTASLSSVSGSRAWRKALSTKFSSSTASPGRTPSA